MILRELIREISERMFQMRGGTRRFRLLVGVALCAVALFAFVGCPDDGGPGNGGPGGTTPDTAPPVITLTGDVVIVEVGSAFTEPGFEVNDDDPNYAGTVTPTIRDSGGTEVLASALTDTAGTYIITYTADNDAAGNTPAAVMRTVQVEAAEPDTALPVITLTGDAAIEVEVGSAFTEPGFEVNDDDPNYAGTVTPTIRDSGGTEVLASALTDTAGTYIITYTADNDAAGNTPVAVMRTVTVRASNPIDIDGDRLIDIDTLEELNAIRNNLAGASYQASAGGTALLCGTDAATACTGYELMRDLDFASAGSYASGVVNPDWIPAGGDPDSATNTGWDPIGSCNTDTNSTDGPCGDSDDDPFVSRFDGNNFAISNLYVRRGAGALGLFGTSRRSTIDRIGVVNARIYGSSGNDFIGGLVGVYDGTITASYATGSIDRLSGHDGNTDIGGLVGHFSGSGTISVSYAAVDIDGGTGQAYAMGGLVGRLIDTVTVIASYATGNISGGDSNDFIGGLIGTATSTPLITASYATGTVDGRGGDEDFVGRAIGLVANGSTHTAIYGFGSRFGAEFSGLGLSMDASRSGTVPNACAITQANSSTAAGDDWDATQWDFGTTVQRPIVLHNGNPVPGQTDRGC